MYFFNILHFVNYAYKSFIRIFDKVNCVFLLENELQFADWQICRIFLIYLVVSSTHIH